MTALTLQILILLILGVSFITANSDFPDPIDKCPDVEIAENFNANSFFKGRWNILKLFGWLPKGNNSCTRIEFLQHEKTNEIELNYFSQNNKNVINNTFTWTIKKNGEISYEGQDDYQSDKGAKPQPFYAKVSFLNSMRSPISI